MRGFRFLSTLVVVFKPILHNPLPTPADFVIHVFEPTSLYLTKYFHTIQSLLFILDQLMEACLSVILFENKLVGIGFEQIL